MTQQVKVRSGRGRSIALIAFAAIVVVAGVLFYTQWIVPGQIKPAGTGQPVAPTLALGGKTGASFANSNVETVMNVQPIVAQAATAAAPPYTPCTVIRGATATPSAIAATAAATQAATMSATAVATQAATMSAATPAATAAATASAANYTVFNIDGSSSQACYQVGETIPGQGKPFNLAIGITTAIAGQIAIDKTNVANSQVGQIVVDVSQLTSDSAQRDGQIRRNWLQSNTYPKATFTPKKIVGLPTGPYTDGTPITFQMIGTMNVHNTDHDQTFDVTATLKGNTLVGSASGDVLMTDFGFQPPTIPGFVTANNQVHLVLNFVANVATK